MRQRTTRWISWCFSKTQPRQAGRHDHAQPHHHIRRQTRDPTPTLLSAPRFEQETARNSECEAAQVSVVVDRAPQEPESDDQPDNGLPENLPRSRVRHEGFPRTRPAIKYRE